MLKKSIRISIENIHVYISGKKWTTNCSRLRDIPSPKRWHFFIYFFFFIAAPLVYGDESGSGRGLSGRSLNTKQGQVLSYATTLFGFHRFSKVVADVGWSGHWKICWTICPTWRQQGHTRGALCPILFWMFFCANFWLFPTYIQMLQIMIRNYLWCTEGLKLNTNSFRIQGELCQRFFFDFSCRPPSLVLGCEYLSWSTLRFGYSRLLEVHQIFPCRQSIKSFCFFLARSRLRLFGMMRDPTGDKWPGAKHRSNWGVRRFLEILLRCGGDWLQSSSQILLQCGGQNFEQLQAYSLMHGWCWETVLELHKWRVPLLKDW